MKRIFKYIIILVICFIPFNSDAKIKPKLDWRADDLVFLYEENDIYYLKGEYIRLKADAYKEDLIKYNKEVSFDELELDFSRDSKLINGCVLHLDGDEYYLKKCMDVYKRYNIPAIGYFMDEKQMDKRIQKQRKSYTS